MRLLGRIALLLYAAHAAWHLADGTPWDLIWACNVSMPILAAGCFLSRARLVAAAIMILAYGTPMWILDLATGGALVPTSPLVHLGGLVVGVLAIRRLGEWPRYSWTFAAIVTAALLLLARLFTPAHANVNLAFRVQPGWESMFPSHVLYVGLMWTSSAAVFALVELVGRRWLMAHEGA